ncbi:hypothetical protein B566_EDAN016113 [Ephemera danica]|nr:hypothetical protein B566_EDAN016113 [Ephemera danica]
MATGAGACSSWTAPNYNRAWFVADTVCAMRVVVLFLLLLGLAVVHAAHEAPRKNLKVVKTKQEKPKVTSNAPRKVTQKIVQDTSTRAPRQNVSVRDEDNVEPTECSSTVPPLTSNRVRRGLTKKQRDNIRKLKQKVEEAGRKIVKEKISKRKLLTSCPSSTTGCTL